MKKLPILLCLLFFTILAFGQRRIIYEQQERDNSGAILLFNFQYGLHWPGGDLAERFGFNNSLGGSIDFVEKHNLLLGAEAFFHFGSRINTDVLAPLRNDDGIIIGDDGELSEVQLRMRGLQIGGHIGKIFMLSKGGKHRSGIRATLGAGFFEHKIRIQDDPVANIALLEKEYKKGYDRLSNGLSLTQFIGYQNLSKSRLLNFIIGVEFTQAFTKNRRSINFDTRMTDTETRIDLLTGIKIGWTLPLYLGENADEINY